MTQHQRRNAICFTLTILLAAVAARAEEPRIYDAGQLPNDSRLADPKDLNDYFPFDVPPSKAAWESRADDLRRRVMIATGVWPMPERTPMNPVIHGKVRRDGFTVEKVYFESMPNHFVTGLLFRPEGEGKNLTGRALPTRARWANAGLR